MADKRVIKRYTNRKLYDKRESRYVTLEEIALLVTDDIFAEHGGEYYSLTDVVHPNDVGAAALGRLIADEIERRGWLPRMTQGVGTE